MKTLTNSKLGLSFSELSLETADPFGISYGTTHAYQNILVKVEYGGLIGLGEAAPANYHAESVETVRACLEKWQSEDLIGNDPFAIKVVSQKLNQSLAGNYSAKAAIEMAMHDLCGKISGQPTYKTLGLSAMKLPITDFTIGLDSLATMTEKTKKAVASGYQVLKVKQGTDYDKDIVKTVRKACGDIPIRVDANGAWTPKRAIEMSKFLYDYGVQFIEQPLPKFALPADFKLVKENSPLPIFADESICQSADVAKYAGCIDGVVVKLAKTGGITEALAVIQTARAHGLAVMFGCMIESSIGVSAAASLASLVDYIDLDGALLLADDPYQGAYFQKGGQLVLSDLPGLGVEVRKK